MRHPPRIGLLCEASEGYDDSWWRWEDLNLRQRAYETPALPLSYTATRFTIQQLRRSWQSGSPQKHPYGSVSRPRSPHKIPVVWRFSVWRGVAH